MLCALLIQSEYVLIFVIRYICKTGENRVLVVDGGASKRVAILGDQITELALQNQWAGVIVNGCIRDSAIIAGMDIGVKALGTHPVKSLKSYPGERGTAVNFGGVEFIPGNWVYADEVCLFRVLQILRFAHHASLSKCDCKCYRMGLSLASLHSMTAHQSCN